MAVALAEGLIPEAEAPQVIRILELSVKMARIEEAFESCLCDETKTVADFIATINNLSVHDGN